VGIGGRIHPEALVQSPIDSGLHALAVATVPPLMYVAVHHGPLVMLQPVHLGSLLLLTTLPICFLATIPGTDSFLSLAVQLNHAWICNLHCMHPRYGSLRSQQ
jgi:hypothetical protein